MPWPIRAVCRRLLTLMKRLGGPFRLAAYAAEIGTGRLLWLIETVEFEYGHFRSVQVGAAVDRDDRPIPWFTYPAIEYLAQLDLRSHRIFEYGAGNSTLFFGQRAQSVTSVESDPSWLAKVERRRSANTTLLCREDEARYVNAVAESGENYDLIIVDGLYRRRCAEAAVERLSDRGFVILDNADWNADAARYLRDCGLIQVDFSGLTPNNLYASTTSLFFKRTVQISTATGRQPMPPIGGYIQPTEPD